MLAMARSESSASGKLPVGPMGPAGPAQRLAID